MPKQRLRYERLASTGETNACCCILLLLAIWSIWEGMGHLRPSSNIVINGRRTRRRSSCGSWYQRLGRSSDGEESSRIPAMGKEEEEEEEEDHERRALSSFSAVLRACSDPRDLPAARRLHSLLVRSGRHLRHPPLANLLIHMYSKCGDLDAARTAFESMSSRDTDSWNSAISSCLRCGNPAEALCLYRRMLSLMEVSAVPNSFACMRTPTETSIMPNKLTSMQMPTETSAVPDKLAYTQIPMETLAMPDDKSTYMRIPTETSAMPDKFVHTRISMETSTMLDAFARMQMPVETLAMPHKLTYTRKPTDTSAMLNKFTYTRMPTENLSVTNKLTHAQILTEASAMSDEFTYTRIPMETSAMPDKFAYTRISTETSTMPDKLTSMRMPTETLAMPGKLTYMQIPIETSAMPNKLTYVQKPTETLAMPDKFTYTLALTAVAGLGCLEEGVRIHDRIRSCRRNGSLRSDATLMTTLLNMYAKCGSLRKAKEVFDGMANPDNVAWSAIISAHAQNGRIQDALLLLTRMARRGVKPNKAIFLCLLNAKCLDLESVSAIQRSFEVSGLDSDVSVNTAFVRAYGELGSPEEARAAFDGMCRRDQIAWVAMIRVYARIGHVGKAFELFLLMESEGVVGPDKFAFLCLLESCAGPELLEHGRMIHDHVLASPLRDDPSVNTALTCMYGKCGSLMEARAVFDRIHWPDRIAWNSMLTVYAHNGHGKEALELFHRMVTEEGVMPDEVTFLCLLNACAGSLLLADGETVHARIVSCGLGSDLATKTALIDMYGKCDSLAKARAIFNATASNRDAIAWNAMLSAYAWNKRTEEALELLPQMGLEGAEPSKEILLCLLNACASQASLDNGRTVHEYIRQCGFESDVTVKNALLNMYGKCGSLRDALSIFDGMHERNVISWSTIVSTCAHNGHGKEALKYFEQMTLEGVKPDTITFFCLLFSCSHMALWDEGLHYFSFMRDQYSVTPLQEHYVCLVDLLCRGGHLNEVEDMVKNMPVQIDSVVRKIVLNTYQSHTNVEHAF